jgi:hypothetical protein
MNYNTFRVSRALGLDAYFIALISKHVGPFTTDTLTAGARVFGQAAGFDYSAEAAYQFGPAYVDGTPRTATVDAYAAEATLGYTLPRTPYKPRLGVSFYRASGDGNPKDDKIHTFNLIWQNQHSRFGGIDLFQGSNVAALTATASFRPRADMELRGDFITARALEATDPAVAFLPSDTGIVPKLGSTYLGAGGDVLLGYNYGTHLDFLVYFALFQPGAYVIDNVGKGDLILKTYVQSRVRF